DLRGLHDAGAEDHLAPARSVVLGAVRAVAQTDTARAVEPEADDLCVRADQEVRPLPGSGEIGSRRRRAPAGLEHELVVAEAILPAAVVVGFGGVARSLRCGQERIAQFVALPGRPDDDGAVPAASRAGHSVDAFEAAEVREHVGPRPAGIAHARPDVVVL